MESNTQLLTLGETHTLPPRYYQYAATQTRVSDWVKRTHTAQAGRHAHRHRGSSSLATTDKQPMSASSSPSRRHSPSNRKTSKSKARSASHPAVMPDPLPPALALVSSSLVVYAFLPSLLVVSAFAILLTWTTMATAEHTADNLDLQESSLTTRKSPERRRTV